MGGEFSEHSRSESDAGLVAAPELDFAGPLHRLDLQPRNCTALHFYSDHQRPHFDLNPPYQRGSVWDVIRRQNLIRSMMLQIPVGSIVLQKDESFTSEKIFTVIDGKQRIEAVRAFVDSEFIIPATWVDPERIVTTSPVDGWPAPGVSYDGLDETFRRKFAMTQMPSIECVDKTLAEQAEIFRLINSGGVEQTAETMAAARVFE